jgi:hypothetical protein
VAERARPEVCSSENLARSVRPRGAGAVTLTALAPFSMRYVVHTAGWEREVWNVGLSRDDLDVKSRIPPAQEVHLERDGTLECQNVRCEGGRPVEPGRPWHLRIAPRHYRRRHGRVDSRVPRSPAWLRHLGAAPDCCDRRLRARWLARDNGRESRGSSE